MWCVLHLIIKGEWNNKRKTRGKKKRAKKTRRKTGRKYVEWKKGDIKDRTSERKKDKRMKGVREK